MRINFIAAGLMAQHGQRRALQRKKTMVAADVVDRLKDFVFQSLRRERWHAMDEIFGDIKMSTDGGDSDAHGVIFAT